MYDYVRSNDTWTVWENPQVRTRGSANPEVPIAGRAFVAYQGLTPVEVGRSPHDSTVDTKELEYGCRVILYWFSSNLVASAVGQQNLAVVFEEFQLSLGFYKIPRATPPIPKQGPIKA